MKFHFDCKIAPIDFWLMAMRRMYKTPIGVCNIVFTAAVFLLTFKFYGTASDLAQVLLILGCMLFTVFQPLIFYFRAKGQVAMIPKDLNFDIDDSGIVVRTGGKSETVPWYKIKQVIKQPGIIILRMENNAGYFLTNRAMGKEKEAFITFIGSKVG